MELVRHLYAGQLKKIEYALIKSELFHLSCRNEISCRSDLKSVVIDSSEQPVERPQKKVGSIIAARKNASLKKFR